MPSNTIVYDSTTITFLALWGAAATVRQQVEIMTRPGVDGVASRLLGVHPPEDQPAWEGIIDTNAVNNVAALQDQINGLEGKLVTVTDVHGIERSAVLVQRVWQIGPIERHAQAIGGVTAGLDRWVMRFGFIMVLTEV